MSQPSLEPAPDADRIGVDINGVMERLGTRLARASFEAAQWEQAYFELKAKDEAAIESLSRQVEFFRTKLAEHEQLDTDVVTLPQSEVG